MDLIVDNLSRGIPGVAADAASQELRRAIGQRIGYVLPTVFTNGEIEQILDSNGINPATPPEEMASVAYRRLIAMDKHPEDAVNLLLAAHSLGARVESHMYELAIVYRGLRRRAIEVNPVRVSSGLASTGRYSPS